MAKEDRRSLITAMEGAMECRLLCYVTGDRRGLETRIAGDIVPLVYEHVREIGVVPKLNVFLYTVGGDSLTGWGLVSLLREFTPSLGIVIPFRALSCGTLISLGANEIVMAKGGQLSPIDPSLASPYNPPAPGQMQGGAVQLLPVSVEDVIGYLKLARDEVGVKGDEGLGQIMAALAEKVHPMALGAVYRSREQVAFIARKLLAMHEKDGDKIDRVVTTLTRDLPSHQYLIGRTEAKELGLAIAEPQTDVERLIWQLYQEYASWLRLDEPYNPETILGGSGATNAVFDRGVVESLKPDRSLRTHVFRTEREIKRVQSNQPGLPFPLIGIQERTFSERWIEVEP